MQLLEDLLSDGEHAAIDRVLCSNENRFHLLAKIAELDPRSDFKYSDLRKVNFCGADLRGFDFSGSDLRQCIRNDNTIYDDSTVFDGAKLDWIEIGALPIHEKMQGLQSVSSSNERMRQLTELITEFGETDHVIAYMTNAASLAKTLEEFLDFALFIPSNSISEEQANRLRLVAPKLLRRKLSQSKSRTRREGTKSFAMNGIVEKLQRSSGSVAEQIYGRLAEIVTSKKKTTSLKDMAFIEQKDMEDAFSQIG